MTSEATRRSPAWKFAGGSVEGQHFLLGGVDVWSQGWRDVPGEKAQVKEPRYGRELSFYVYEIDGASGPIRFAAGEVSACVFLFFVPESGEPAPEPVPESGEPEPVPAPVAVPKPEL